MSSEFQGATLDCQWWKLLPLCVIGCPHMECLQTTIICNCAHEFMSWQCGSSDMGWLRLESSPFIHESILCKERAWWLAGWPWLTSANMFSSSLHPFIQQACSGLFSWLLSKFQTWKWPLDSESLHWDGIHSMILSWPKQVTGQFSFHREKLKYKLQVYMLSSMGKVTAVISLLEWLTIIRWLSK